MANEKCEWSIIRCQIGALCSPRSVFLIQLGTMMDMRVSAKKIAFRSESEFTFSPLYTNDIAGKIEVIEMY